MVKGFLFSLLLCGLFVTGCTSDTVPDGPLPITDSKFIPLEVGNFWIYRVQAFKADGTPIGNPAPDTLFAVEMQGRYGFSSYKVTQNSQPLNTIYYYFDGDTTFSFQANPPGSQTDTARSIIGINSMNAGEEIVLSQQNGSNNIVYRDIFRLDVTDAKINPGFELFTCQKIIESIIKDSLGTQDTLQKLISYYALGKGLIRQEVYFKDSPTNKLYLGSSLILTSYFVQ